MNPCANIGKCTFRKPWVGLCMNPTNEGEQYCPEHSNVRCECGAQAAGECGITIGPLICGIPTCIGGQCEQHGMRKKHVVEGYDREKFLALQEQAGYVGTD